MLFYEILELASASTPEHRLPVDIKCKWLQNVALKLETVKASQPHKKTYRKLVVQKNLMASSVKPQQLADFRGAPKSTGYSSSEKEDDYISQSQ